MKKAYVEMDGKQVVVDITKEYMYRGTAYVKYTWAGKEIKIAKELVKAVKNQKIKKPVYAHIDGANAFDGKCIAEIFRMVKNGRTDYERGFVLLEVKTRKGVESYAVYRLDIKTEIYHLEYETKSAQDVCTHLDAIDNYDAVSWYKGFAEICDVQSNQTEWYNEVMGELA